MKSQNFYCGEAAVFLAQIKLTTTLEDLRRWRNIEEDQEIRSVLNEVCDRLAVLQSKAIERDRADGALALARSNEHARM